MPLSYLKKKFDNLSNIIRYPVYISLIASQMF